MAKLIVWLLIRLTPIFWAGFVYTLARHVWQYHRPGIQFPDISMRAYDVAVYLVILGVSALVVVIIIWAGSSIYALYRHDEPSRPYMVEECTSRECISGKTVSVGEPEEPKTKVAHLPPGVVVPDGVFCRHQIGVSDISPIAIVCDDHSSSHVLAMIEPPPDWDGESVRISARVISKIATPNGKIRMHWEGICQSEDQIVSPPKWDSSFLHYNGFMDIRLEGMMQDDMVVAKTNGDIHLTGCQPGSGQLLFIRGKVDVAETYSTHIDRNYFVSFDIELKEKHDAIILSDPNGGGIRFYEDAQGMVMERIEK